MKRLLRVFVVFGFALMSQLRCSVGHDLPSLQPFLKIVYPKF